MRPLAWLPLPAFCAAVVASTLGTAAPAAQARPDYARKEGKACAFCHTNARGGGPRNAKGNEYEQNGFTFATRGKDPKGFGENDAFTTEANGRAFYYVREAIELGHWSDALRRLGELRKKEPKGPGAQLVLNTETQVENRGKDLARSARQAIAAGKATEAAEHLVRLETEFKGREPAKEAPRLRAELQKLPGARDAEAAAKAIEAQRLRYLEALMRDVEGDVAGAVSALTDLVDKHPEGPFAALAKEKLVELRKPIEPPPPGMGG